MYYNHTHECVREHGKQYYISKRLYTFLLALNQPVIILEPLVRVWHCHKIQNHDDIDNKEFQQLCIAEALRIIGSDDMEEDLPVQVYTEAFQASL